MPVPLFEGRRYLKDIFFICSPDRLLWIFTLDNSINCCLQYPSARLPVVASCLVVVVLLLYKSSRRQIPMIDGCAFLSPLFCLFILPDSFHITSVHTQSARLPSLSAGCRSAADNRRYVCEGKTDQPVILFNASPYQTIAVMMALDPLTTSA